MRDPISQPFGRSLLGDMHHPGQVGPIRLELPATAGRAGSAQGFAVQRQTLDTFHERSPEPDRNRELLFILGQVGQRRAVWTEAKKVVPLGALRAKIVVA